MEELVTWAGSLGFLGGTVVTLVSFLGGTFFRAWIEKSIEAKFDRDIEDIRSQMRQSDRRVEAIRDSALSAAAHSNDILTKRRIDAIERLWASAAGLRRFKFGASAAQKINMEEAIEIAGQQDAEGQAVREFAEQILKATTLEKAPMPDSPDAERLFVSPLAWALFSTYRSVLALALMQLTAMRAGVGKSFLKRPDDLIEAVKTALPHQSGFIDRYGVDGLNFLVEELEEKLFATLLENLKTPSADADNVARAAEIMKAVERAAESAEADTAVPPQIKKRGLN